MFELYFVRLNACELALIFKVVIRRFLSGDICELSNAEDLEFCEKTYVVLEFGLFLSPGE